MRDKEDCPRKTRESFLDGFARFNVKVVCDLVQQQQVRPARKKSGQSNLGAFPGAERLDGKFSL